MNSGPPDGISYEGALRHAKMIAAYWEKRGYHILPRVENVAFINGKTTYGVRSDMVSGMPQRRR